MRRGVGPARPFTSVARLIESGAGRYAAAISTIGGAAFDAFELDGSLGA